MYQSTGFFFGVITLVNASVMPEAADAYQSLGAGTVKLRGLSKPLVEEVLVELQSLSALRTAAWSDVPSSPGVYWWYFPQAALNQLHITELSDPSKLRLRYASDGKVCLYHGMANNLAGRVKWHAAQRLTESYLRSGFLSTFRLTLLALNDFDYLQGAAQIDAYFDALSITWRAAATREEAKMMEESELRGEYHYPLNIQGNRKPELREFIRQLKSLRRSYKDRFLAATIQSV